MLHIRHLQGFIRLPGSNLQGFCITAHGELSQEAGMQLLDLPDADARRVTKDSAGFHSTSALKHHETMSKKRENPSPREIIQVTNLKICGP